MIYHISYMLLCYNVYVSAFRKLKGDYDERFQSFRLYGETSVRASRIFL